MPTPHTADMASCVPETRTTGRITGLLSLAVWLVFIVIASAYGHWKLTVVSVVACAAMCAGAGLALGAIADKQRIVFCNSAAAGALLAAACLFVLPEALQVNPAQGVAGIAIGLLTGIALRPATALVSRHKSHLHPIFSALTLHALSEGLVLGVLYGVMPALSVAFGIAIIAHKLPAGYAVAATLPHQRDTLAKVLLPACATGLACLPVALLIPAQPHGWAPVVFGFASGLFVYVAATFIATTRKSSEHHGQFITAALLGMGIVAATWVFTA